MQIHRIPDFLEGSGDPNGSVAVVEDNQPYWDYTNGILYIGTTENSTVWRKVATLNLSQLEDVDVTGRVDGSSLVWSASNSMYEHSTSGGSGSGLEYARLQKYAFTASDVTSAGSNGYLDIDIKDSSLTTLEVSDSMVNNGIEIQIGRLNTYYGDVSSGDDWELIQGTASAGYANVLRVHEDWVVEGEIVTGYVIRESAE